MTILKTFLYIRAVALLSIAILATQPLHAQSHEEDKYFSSEQEAYYDSLHHPSLEPASREEILSFRLPHIHIKELRSFTPFKDIYSMSPEQKQELKEFYEAQQVPNMVQNGILPQEGTSGVSKLHIIKKGSLNGGQAILFTDDRFDESREGIWVALYDESKQWKCYYTGLAQGKPLFLKWDSRLPLLKDSGRLQIEAAFLREFYSPKHFFPIHDAVKDGVTVEIDLKAIIADTDGDGLSDVTEAKLGLDPSLRDTDRDGIIDSLDPNPRFNLPRTDFSVIYQALLSDTYIPPTNGYSRVPYMANYKMLLIEPKATRLIVSDSRHVQSITLSDERVIILTDKAYKQHRATYPSTLKQYYLSPLFKVDGMPDTYRLRVSFGLGGTEYLIRKGRGGWEYKMLSTWIE
ncbi:thrombospondin type 3 repeat-containing protein [Pontibacter mangrovi]|uniref:Uncharacterized protein n=1 Tax=Pontibacter mangrovi TaxID=2589816 RepID=A0A501VXL2_9BACT|nr:thrombospondin type 3 repeat-containing protein [Pontibacter mangrovi]TPE42463.1 hypothetical protein FJM65_17810 [Pontibacter mangrovi]